MLETSFEDSSRELLAVHLKFQEMLDEQGMVVALESYMAGITDNPFDRVTSFEAEDQITRRNRTFRGRESFSPGKIADDIATGLAKKTLRGAVDGAKQAGGFIAKNALPAGKKLIELARKLSEKLAEMMNTVTTATSKMLASGYPLMGMIRKKAAKLKAHADKTGAATGTIELKKAGKYLVVGDKLLSPPELIKRLDQLGDVSKVLLGDDKLDKFKQMSLSILQPYKDSIKSSKTDYLVFGMAVLALLTNPGVIAGSVFKKLLSAANPSLGEKGDLAIKAVTSPLYGTASFLPTMGHVASNIKRGLSSNKLDISVVPKFKPIYPFCKTPVELKEGSDLLTCSKSDVIIGNKYWMVTDYADTITGDMKVGVGRVGVSFKEDTHDAPEGGLKVLNKNEIVQLCDIIIDIMTSAERYCKQWPVYAKEYNQLYRQVSDVVMTTETDDSKKSLVNTYIRYSYRNAMNTLVGGIWNNCFGSDNAFLRHVVMTCRVTLSYIEKSMVDVDDSDD